MNGSYTVAALMQTLFFQDAPDVARETGFQKRDSKLKPGQFAQAVAMSFLAEPGSTLDELAQTAAQVGAPVNAKERCRPNIEVAFTDASQPFIDKVRAVNAVLLGYADNDAQLKALATVRRPIQAWYTTQTKDLRGKGEVDRVRREGMTVEMPMPPPCMGKCTYTITYPDAHFWEVTGSRLGDGLRSSFFHVIIVVEPAKLAEQEMGTLADYVAMVALAQIPAQDNCQPLPSIMNLLAKDCTAGAPNALTASDLGYLRGLYKISADRTLSTQESEIAYQMEQGLKEEKP